MHSHLLHAERKLIGQEQMELYARARAPMCRERNKLKFKISGNCTWQTGTDKLPTTKRCHFRVFNTKSRNDNRRKNRSPLHARWERRHPITFTTEWMSLCRWTFVHDKSVKGQNDIFSCRRTSVKRSKSVKLIHFRLLCLVFICYFFFWFCFFVSTRCQPPQDCT